MGFALALSPMGADVKALDLPGVMVRLGAVQALDQEERQALFRRIWTTANGPAPPDGQGYRNLATEIALEAAFRLRRTS